MKITRLSWAGLMLESGATTLYVDPLENVDAMRPFLGAPKFPMLPVPQPKSVVAGALVTHIHADHFDQELLKQLLGDRWVLWAPEPVAQIAVKDGLKACNARLYDTFYVGDFKITPVPAVDWVGDEQVSYVISDGVHSILHGGDTNWHGYWWSIAKRFPSLAAAFLPVNGVVGAIPGQDVFSEMQGTMDPNQAVTATRILKAGFLVPIHYRQFDNPPGYTQFHDLDDTLDLAGIEQNIGVRRLKDGETIEI